MEGAEVDSLYQNYLERQDLKEGQSLMSGAPLPRWSRATQNSFYSRPLKIKGTSVSSQKENIERFNSLAVTQQQHR